MKLNLHSLYAAETVVQQTLPRFFVLFSFNFYHEQNGKSVDTTRKSVVKLVKLPNLKVIRLKRAKI